MPRAFSEIKANPLLRQMDRWFINPPQGAFGSPYPREVVMMYSCSVVVHASYADELNLFERHTELDIDGNCHATMLVTDGTKLYTEEEADSIAQCIDADQQLLSYAR